ncbi:MAG: hypothetical protein M1820_004703 [Bogoriella megaspora]|nr:MAG: hypothetical protein M1820_004703 [Bogoriella megaspora]
MKLSTFLPAAALLATSIVVEALPLQDAEEVHSLVPRMVKKASTEAEIQERIKGSKTTLNGEKGWRLSDKYFLYHDGKHYRAYDVFNYNDVKYITTAHLAAKYAKDGVRKASKEQPYIPSEGNDENDRHRDWSGNKNKPGTIPQIMNHLGIKNPPGYDEREDGPMTHEEYLPASVKPAGTSDQNRLIEGAFCPQRDQSKQGSLLDENNVYSETVRKALKLKYQIPRSEFVENVPGKGSSRYAAFEKLFDYYKKNRFTFNRDDKVKKMDKYKKLPASV